MHSESTKWSESISKIREKHMIKLTLNINTADNVAERIQWETTNSEMMNNKTVKWKNIRDKRWTANCTIYSSD